MTSSAPGETPARPPGGWVRVGSGAPPGAPSAPGEGSPTVRGSCTRTSALSSGEWPPSRGLLSAESGPSWYFLLLTGRGSKSLPGPRQSPEWWLSPFCSWRGEGWAWPAVRTSAPQRGAQRVADPGGGTRVPKGREHEGPGWPGGKERQGGAAGVQTPPTNAHLPGLNAG